MKWKLMCLAIILSVSPMVLADYILGSQQSNTLSRYTDDFKTRVWQITGQSPIQQVKISPIDGDVYVGFTGDVIKRFNIKTGTQVGANSGAVYFRKDDLVWGYDYNSDGTPDIWTVGNIGTNASTPTVGHIQVYPGANSSTTSLADFAVICTSGTVLDGTGGRACFFGPDLTGDGVKELYTVVGWNSQGANERITVWNPVVLKASGASAAGAKVYSVAATDIREPSGMILGPDVNGDGRKDIWILSIMAYGNSQVVTYDYTTGAKIKNMTFTPDFLTNGSRNPRGMDIMNGPNGTVLFATRFTSVLDPINVLNTEVNAGNIIQYDPKTATAKLLFSSPWKDVAPLYNSGNVIGIGRMDTVAYFNEKQSYAPAPADEAMIPTTRSTTLTWVLPDPNKTNDPITCDVYFSSTYPNYGFEDPNNGVIDPNFTNYATKIVSNQAVTSADLASLISLNSFSYGTTYYWRVDCYDPTLGKTVGKVWKFTADNTPPQVNAGTDVTAWLTGGTVTVTMAATVTDDGKPNPPGAYTMLWTLDSGTAGNITIDSPTIEDTTATITATGTYVLRLTANDSALSNTDTVVVNVYADACAAAKAQTGYAALPGDLNNDCNVNLDDLLLFAPNWLSFNALQ